MSLSSTGGVLPNRDFSIKPYVVGGGLLFLGVSGIIGGAFLHGSSPLDAARFVVVGAGVVMTVLACSTFLLHAAAKKNKYELDKEIFEFLTKGIGEPQEDARFKTIRTTSPDTETYSSEEISKWKLSDEAKKRLKTWTSEELQEVVKAEPSALPKLWHLGIVSEGTYTDVTYTSDGGFTGTYSIYNKDGFLDVIPESKPACIKSLVKYLLDNRVLINWNTMEDRCSKRGRFGNSVKTEMMSEISAHKVSDLFN